MTNDRHLKNVTYFVVLTSLAAQIFLSSPAVAAESDWIGSEGGDVRLVALAPTPDGDIPAILDIRLKPGWKTYWLDPGASGIAPQLSFDATPGVTFSGLRFPAPKTFDDGVVRYTGYDRSVAFPLLLKTSDPSTRKNLKASVFLGICKDICIPVQGDLDVPLTTAAAHSPLDAARIEAAVEALPAAPSETFKVVSANFDPAAKVIHLALKTPPDQTGSAVDFHLAGPPGFSFGKAINIKVEDGRVSADIPVREPTRGGALKSGSVLLAVTAGSLSMQTPLAFD